MTHERLLGLSEKPEFPRTSPNTPRTSHSQPTQLHLPNPPTQLLKPEKQPPVLNVKPSLTEHFSSQRQQQHPGVSSTRRSRVNPKQRESRGNLRPTMMSRERTLLLWIFSRGLRGARRQRQRREERVSRVVSITGKLSGMRAESRGGVVELVEGVDREVDEAERDSLHWVFRLYICMYFGIMVVVRLAVHAVQCRVRNLTRRSGMSR